MIPKKIHYCWFGENPLPKKAKKCIESWKIFFPDYEIIEWNESNFNVNYNAYTKEAYENKKYAFLTDVARLVIIYEHGGIYFDVDVEVIKKYNDILQECQAFFGIEKNGEINTGLGFGAEKGNQIIKKLLNDYDNKHILKNDGTLDLTPCTKVNSRVILCEGFQLSNTKEIKNGVVIYPQDYFNPLESATGRLKITKNTHSIHWYAKSWVPKHIVIRSYITKPFHLLFGKDCFSKIKTILKIK